MRHFPTLFALVLLIATQLRAQSPIQIAVDPHPTGSPIPADFCGLSFESSNLLPDKQGNYLFSANNTELIDLFRTIGIKNLRIGGGTAEMAQYRVPAPADIDQLFAFAQAADVKVIYTLRLLNGNSKQAAEIARYIQSHYASAVTCFELGNEPDWHSYHTSPGHDRDPRIFETIPNNAGSAFPAFLATWNDFAAEITHCAPDAKFTGPDTGSNHPLPGTPDTDFDRQSWTLHFARAQKDSHRLLFVAQHDYVGETAARVTPTTAIESMLSKEWIEHRYPLLFEHALAPVLKEGFSYRMTEANDYTGGVDGASNAYASALWALDYLHWHAAHHSAGINFHNKRWIFTDTVLPDSAGKLHFNPKAYAIKAFSLGGGGMPTPIRIENAANANLTAYSVRDGNALFVTLIDKEFGPTAKARAVSVRAEGIAGHAVAVTLQTRGNDPADRDEITLGGASLTTSSWSGQWSDVGPAENSQMKIEIQPASAIVVKLQLAP